MKDFLFWSLVLKYSCTIIFFFHFTNENMIWVISNHALKVEISYLMRLFSSHCFLNVEEGGDESAEYGNA